MAPVRGVVAEVGVANGPEQTGVVLLKKLGQPGKGTEWSLEVGAERLRLVDPTGRVAAVWTPEEAARGISLPALDAQAGELVLRSGEDRAKFFASGPGLGLIRAVVVRGVVRCGGREVRRFRRPGRRKIAFGVAALFIFALPGVFYLVALLSGRNPSLLVGGFCLSVGVLGVVEIARGRALLRQADRTLRQARADNAATAVRTTQPAAAPARVAHPPRPAALARDDGTSPLPTLVILGVVGAVLAVFAIGGAISLLMKPAARPARDSTKGTVARPTAEPPRADASPPPPPRPDARTETPAEPPRVQQSSEAAPPERSPPAPTRPAQAPARPAVSGACEWAVRARSLKPGALVSNSRIRLVQEKSAVTLDAPVRCDATGPGEWKGGLNGGDTVAAGTRVSSYLLHVNGDGRRTLHLSGSVTFPSEVLGLIASNEGLDASDDVLGRAGLEYPAGGQFRGWFDGDGDDLVALSADRRTVTMVSHTGKWVDQIRVITAADR